MIGILEGWKLSVAAIVAVACVSLAAAVGAEAVAAKPAATKLTIQVRSDRLVGFVSSPDPERCAAGRRIVVFEQLGAAPNQGSDKRIAGVRASREDGAYKWSTATPRPGRFYAQAPGKPGCAADLSRSVRSAPGPAAPAIEPPAGDLRTDYPPCGPYVNEGTSFICKFEQLHLDLEGVGTFSKCRFGEDSSACQGVANGLFPWGRTFASRGRPKVKIGWSWNGSSRDLTVITYRDDQGATGVANLTGTVPNAGSPRFTVTEAFAQSGDGYPNGNHFYTPNLPGQGPGEPGGPLAINFQNGTGTDWGAVADIWGYLYLKR